jgi:hypothetical protein
MSVCWLVKWRAGIRRRCIWNNLRSKFGTRGRRMGYSRGISSSRRGCNSNNKTTSSNIKDNLVRINGSLRNSNHSSKLRELNSRVVDSRLFKSKAGEAVDRDSLSRISLRSIKRRSHIVDIIVLFLSFCIHFEICIGLAGRVFCA